MQTQSYILFFKINVTEALGKKQLVLSFFFKYVAIAFI